MCFSEPLPNNSIYHDKTAKTLQENWRRKCCQKCQHSQRKLHIWSTCTDITQIQLTRGWPDKPIPDKKLFFVNGHNFYSRQHAFNLHLQTSWWRVGSHISTMYKFIIYILMINLNLGQVNPEMSCKLVLSSVSFVAFGAPETLLPSVRCHVALQIAR